jgi:pimeloyl-ACP methyl ester carboxylesterase
MIRMLLTIVITIAIVYVGFALLLYFTQAKFVYYPHIGGREIVATPEYIGLEYEDVVFVTADTCKLAGWFIPVEDSRGVILFCHGNAGNISHRLETIQMFNELKLSTFIFDYRGYGESEGKITEEGTYQDVEAAWNYLIQERGISSGEIIIFGRSLGGAIGAWLAKKHDPGALILESTFTSIADVAVEIYPIFPVRLMCRFGYNTKEYIKKITCPVLIIHNQEDEIIPFSHGQKLFNTAHEPKQFLEIRGTHNVMQSMRDYQAGIDAFITQFIEK